MIIELSFLIGVATGFAAGGSLFYFLYWDDFQAVKEFNRRQEKYRKMI